MKNIKTIAKTTIIALSVSILNVSNIYGQEKSYPEPDVYFKIYYFDEKSNESVEMENGSFEVKTRMKGYGGIGKDELAWSIAGAKSAVRIPKSQNTRFLFKLSDPNQDISEMYHLVKLTYNSKTKQREYISSKGASWTDKVEINDDFVRYTVKKVKEFKDEDGITVIKVIRLITVENLEPGEYVWMRKYDENDCQFFGVD
jgi:hypothetical protein